MTNNRRRKYFGGIYTSTRTLNAGDRVERRNQPHTRGVIVYVIHDDLAGRTALVRWNDGGEQLNLTSDLRRVS